MSRESLVFCHSLATTTASNSRGRTLFPYDTIQSLSCQCSNTMLVGHKRDKPRVAVLELPFLSRFFFDEFAGCSFDLPSGVSVQQPVAALSNGTGDCGQSFELLIAICAGSIIKRI